jgi:hypothetical protein
MRYECKYRKGHQFGRPLAPRDPRLERPGQKRSAGKCPKTWTGPHKEQNERHRYSNDSMGAPWVPTSHPKMLPSGAQTRPNLTGTPKDYVYTFFQLCMLQAIHISVTWWRGKGGLAKRQQNTTQEQSESGQSKVPSKISMVLCAPYNAYCTGAAGRKSRLKYHGNNPWYFVGLFNASAAQARHK